MTMNSATRVSLEKATVMPNISTSPMPMHSALTTPMISAAMNAPEMLPSPPATVTTKASAITARSMLRLAGSRGSCNAPARPASSAPTKNTPENSRA